MNIVAMRRAVPVATSRAVFTVTVFVGSFLLFLVQPLFARMILPKLGGAPSVWNTAMLCYQGMLLLGYLYAHAISLWPPKRQVATHFAVLAIAAATLPIGMASFYPDSGGHDPALWLIGLLVVSIGPVFFAVSAQAPLMQSWFSRSGDPAAGNPYFLYAASNTGSLLALVAYPFLLEPNLRLVEQSTLWSAGFALLVLLVAACALILPRGEVDVLESPREPAVRASWRRRLHWMALAAVPSGLMLSTTTHITTDVMAMPLLWVIPLALYLVTFIIAFAENGARLRRIAAMAAPYIVYVLSCLVLVRWESPAGTFAVQLVLFFVAALGLHIALAAQKPAPAQLTEFFLWMSIGGVVGGLFCALLAPSLFDWTYEHPILLLAAIALLPTPAIPSTVRALWDRPRTSPAMRYAVPVAFLGLATLGFMPEAVNGSLLLGLFMIFLVAGAAMIGRAGHAVWAAAALMLVAGGWVNLKLSAEPGVRERSFFGVSSVLDDEEGTLRKLAHGTTVHGMQSLRPGHETDRLAYYAARSGIGMVMTSLDATVGPSAHVGFIGLGAGTLPCFATAGQSWTAFEIDPTVIAIATDSSRFSFISRCKPDLRIVLGDARLTLSKEAPATYDVLVADAFSSDAIPLHLVTVEAFDGYSRALKDDGIFMMNITNRYLDLEPVLAAIAAQRGWSAWIRHYRPGAQALLQHDAESRWVIMARSEARARQVLDGAGGAPGDWSRLQGRGDVQAWTDDFSSILPILSWRR